MPKKILICDDDEGILNVIDIILTENKYRVLSLNSAKGILKEVQSFNPDLILVDLWMPGMDGREVIKMLKNEPLLKDIPVVIVSALSDTEAISKTCGADGFLPKPFEMDELLRIASHFTNLPVKAKIRM